MFFAVALLFTELSVALFIRLPFFAAKRFQLSIDLGFAFLELPSEHILRQILFFQRELIGYQFPIQLSTLRVVGSAESLSSSAELGLALACALRPLLKSDKPLLQVRSSFDHLRVLNRPLRKAVVGVQPQGEKIVLDDGFLGRPAVNVGLGQFDGINRRCLLRRHNGNQLGRHLFGRSSGGLPVLSPPGPLIKWQVAVPPSRIRCFLWIRPDRNRPTQVTNERHL